MALPKLNATPKYELTIPSNGKTVRFRPYLVKEEKVLMMASESKDSKAILNAVVDTIKDCLEENSMVDISKLTTFDIEYMFTKIRSKSVGEISKVNVRCQKNECDHIQEIEIDLDTVEVPVKKGQNTVRITEDIAIQLNWPSYKMVIDENLTEAKNDITSVFSMIAGSIESILVGDERLSAKDQTKEELLEFINSMTSSQFEKITDFFSDIPQMEKCISFNCQKCNQTNDLKLKGMSDFF